jgi:hypothetical protein
VGRSVGRVIGHDFASVGTDGFDLANGVQILTFEKLNINDHEWFEPGSELACRAPNALCHSPNLPVLP